MTPHDDRGAAQRRLAMLESVVVNTTDAVIVTAARIDPSTDDRIVYVNAAFTRMTGYSAAEAVGQTPRMLQGPLTDRRETARIAAALSRTESVTAELINYRKDGSVFTVEFNISPVRDADARPMYFIAIERETTLRRALERYEQGRSLVLELAMRNEPLTPQLARIAGLLKDVIPGSLGTVMLLEDGRLRVAAADTDLSPAYIGAIDGLQVGPECGACGAAVFHRAAVICGNIETDSRWLDFREFARAANVRACWSIPLFATGGEVMGAFALSMDRAMLPTAHQRRLVEETARFAALVVDRHRDRLRLERIAHYDGLTNLPNRKFVEDSLAAATALAERTGVSVALGILDIDRFKAVNDAFGHHVGDQVLRQIADRLPAFIGAGDVLGRMAGDEFVVIFSDVSGGADGVKAATRLIEGFATPFIVEGNEIVVRASLGLAFYPATSTQPAVLFAAADTAMYAAKGRGGGVEIAQVPKAGTALKLLDLERDLRYALERDEFVLWYQMMFDVNSGHPVGAEALLRWNHPQLGMISPDDFVPLAEANGTIIAIGSWVIDDAARTLRSWRDAGHDVFVTVNVSALQFDAPGVVETVTAALERHALPPQRMQLELTETLLMRDPASSEATLSALKALGVRIVIDDFGTGYSSLAYLQRFSFDALKIDRAFVCGIGAGAASASRRSEHIVAAVVALAGALGVSTIAEGVENATQYDFVKSCGCTIVQGFLCARPMPAAQLAWSRTTASTRRLGLARALRAHG